MQISPDSRAAAITAIYAHASTFPCKVVTDAGSEWVMKLRGSGPGPMALLTEFVALRVASAMGLAVPKAQPLYLSPDFPWTIGTDEFDGIIQRSGGWNLGVEFVDDATIARPEDIAAAAPTFLGPLADVDRLLCNTDRSARNPNILATATGLIAIDFDACLFLRRAARGVVPTHFALPPDHLLYGRALPQLEHRLNPEVALGALRDAPAEWTTGYDSKDLQIALGTLISAWNDAADRTNRSDSGR